jgi:hypothetical protein
MIASLSTSSAGAAASHTISAATACGGNAAQAGRSP